MNFEAPNKKVTQEEMAKNQKSRILSDAELVNGGADVSATGQIYPTEEQINSARLEMGDDFYQQNKELQRRELELKLKVVQKELEMLKESNWWEKEYEGYNILGKDKIAEGSKILEGLPEDDKREIVSHYTSVPRYAVHQNWLNSSNMINKYGMAKMNQIGAYFHSKSGLETYLRVRREDLMNLLKN